MNKKAILSARMKGLKLEYQTFYSTKDDKSAEIIGLQCVQNITILQPRNAQHVFGFANKYMKDHLFELRRKI